MIFSTIKQLMGASELEAMSTKQLQRQIALNTLQAQKIALDKQETASTIALTQADVTELTTKQGLTSAMLMEIKTKLGLEATERGVWASTKALTAADIEHAVATLNCDTATKANIKSLLLEKTAMEGTAKSAGLLSKALGLIKAHPIIAVAGAITLAVVAIDAFTTSAKEAQDALNSAISDNEQAKSELQSISRELEIQESQLNELASKDKLTYAEKGQLEELRNITSELRTQEEIAKRMSERSEKEAANSAVEAFSTLYGDGSYNRDEVEYFATNPADMAMPDDNYDITGNLSGYVQMRERIAETTKKILDPESFKLSDDDLFDLQNQFDNYQLLFDGFATNIDEINSDLEQKIQTMQLTYDSAITKRNSGSILTTDENNIINTYEQAKELQKFIFEITDPNTWNSIQLSDIFATDGIEKTKNELIAMAQDGTLNEDMIASYTNLYAALENGNLILEDGQTAAQVLCEEIYALAEGAERLDETLGTSLDTLPSTISDSVQQIAKQIQPQFDALGEAYKNIFTEDGFTTENIGHEMFENIRSSFADLEEELGVTFDTAEIDEFLGVLDNTDLTAGQAQDAFDKLATSWFYSSTVLDTLNEDTARSIQLQLEELGVTNAEAFVHENLTAKLEAESLQRQIAAQEAIALANNTEFSIAAFLDEAKASEITRTYLFKLVAAEEVFNNKDLSVDDRIEKLEELATSYGQTALAANIARLQEEAAKNGYELTESDLAAYQEVINKQLENIQNFTIDFKRTGTGASSAGKDAADAYVEAFEKELEQLQGLRDRGEISEKEYLERLKELYIRYFKDKKQYAEQYAKYEREYLEGTLNLMESAVSGITKLMSRKIDALNDARDAAIDALEAERDAAEEAYQARIDAIDDAIDAQQDIIDSKQDIIDGIQDEIDAMRGANDERQREIDLEQKKYNLERARYQNTNLIYRSNKGFVYENDQSSVRNAQQELEDAQLEIDVAAKEKEIELIEKEIEALEKQIEAFEDQKEAIEEAMEASNKYFDKLIEQTQSYYDSMISALEKQKSQWEELLTYKEVAEAYSAIEQVFGDLGYTVQDVMDGNAQAFEDFKAKYIAVLNDMNSNSNFTDGLVYATGVAKENLGSFINETQKAADKVDEFGKLNPNFDKISSAVSGLSDDFNDVAESAQAATKAISGGATGGKTAGKATGKDAGGKDTGGTSEGNADSFYGAISSGAEEAKNNLADITGALAGEGEESVLGAINTVIDKIGVSTETEEAGTDTLVGTIEQAKNSGTDDLGELGGAFDGLHEHIDGVISKVGELIAIIGQAASALADLQNGMSSLPNIGGGGGNKPNVNRLSLNAAGTMGKAFATGTQGLAHDEELAVRSEFNQPELTIYPNGDVELTNSPTVGFLPKDTVIFNERQTRKLLNNKGSVKGRAYANGTSKFIPLEKADPDKAKLLKVVSSLTDTMDLSHDLLKDISDNVVEMSQMTNNILTVDKSSSAGAQVTIGDIHLHDVNSADALAKTIVNRLPNMVIQEIHKR